MTARFAARARCALTALLVVPAFVASGCASQPAAQPSAGSGVPSAAASAVTGSPEQWQDAVCRDDVETDSGTQYAVDGSACVPNDGDGIVNFDTFDSPEAMDSALSWEPSQYVAKTIVDGKPMAIWTPSGESGDLDPLKDYGFSVASYQAASFNTQAQPVPAESVAAAGSVAVPIAPNQYGYVAVQTADGATQCIVQPAFVGCETAASNWPQHADGSGAYHGVRINSDGTGNWVDGNLGLATPTTLASATYAAMGWTIVSDRSGMRFTNNATGHGAVVTPAAVQPF